MSRLLARLMREEYAEVAAKAVAKALREPSADAPEGRFRTAPAGDPGAMRGTPIMAKGVSGTMPRTQPEAEALRRFGEWDGRG